MRTTARMCVLACLLQAGAGMTQEAPTPERSGAATWVSGGVGQEEREAMAAVRNDYNLRLTFATRRSGELRADVALKIADGKRHEVLMLERAGPQVYARLPPGTYQVEATAGDQVQRRTVTVGRGGARELYFYWPDDAETAAR